MPTLNDFELDATRSFEHFAQLYPRDVRSSLQPTSTQKTTLIVAGCYIVAIAILWYVLYLSFLSFALLLVLVWMYAEQGHS